MPTPVAHSEDAFAIRVEPRRSAAGKPERRRKGARLPWFQLGFSSAAVIAVVTYVARESEPKPAMREREPSQPVVASAPPLWQPITSPTAIYAIHASDLQTLPFTFEARQHVSGAREDALSYGAFELEGQTHMRVVLRAGPERTHSFFVDLARRAADVGLAVTRSAQATGLPTKFGAAETAEVALSSSTERNCRAIRFAHAAAEFHIVGWFCGANGQRITDRELTCLIDRVALTSAAADPALKTLFAEAETKRLDVCRPSPAPPVRKAAPPRAGRHALTKPRALRNLELAHGVLLMSFGVLLTSFEKSQTLQAARSLNCARLAFATCNEDPPCAVSSL